MLSSDYATDTVIQKSLRNELNSDVTLITVAHRLQTIMDSDKIVCALFILRLPVLSCFSDGARRRSSGTLDNKPIPLCYANVTAQMEFDAPQNLLKKEGSLLKTLVDQSGDREALYAMAQGKKQGSSGSSGSTSE